MSSTLAALSHTRNMARPRQEHLSEHRRRTAAGISAASSTAKISAAAVAIAKAIGPPTRLIKTARRKQKIAKPSSPGTMPRSSARTPAGPALAVVKAHTC